MITERPKPSATQLKLLEFLSDGVPRSVEDLLQFTDDGLAQPTAVKMMMHRLKAVLPAGTIMICKRRADGVNRWSLARRIPSSDE